MTRNEFAIVVILFVLSGVQLAAFTFLADAEFKRQERMLNERIDAIERLLPHSGLEGK